MPRSIVLSCLLTLVATGSAFAQDMPLSDVLIPGEGWELVSEGHKFTEGPAADADGLVYFVDVPNSKIFRIEADGQVTTVDENAERTSGLSFSSGGKLYACRNGGKKVVVYPDPKNDPAQVKVLAEDVTVNDLVADRAGGVYFTDPKNSRVVYVDPGQRLHVVAENLNPNGITLWSDYGTLVVTEGTEQWLWAFRVEPGGLLSGRGPYYSVVQIPSGEERPALTAWPLMMTAAFIWPRLPACRCLTTPGATVERFSNLRMRFCPTSSSGDRNSTPCM